MLSDSQREPTVRGDYFHESARQRINSHGLESAANDRCDSKRHVTSASFSRIPVDIGELLPNHPLDLPCAAFGIVSALTARKSWEQR